MFEKHLLDIISVNLSCCKGLKEEYDGLEVDNIEKKLKELDSKIRSRKYDCCNVAAEVMAITVQLNQGTLCFKFFEDRKGR